MGNWEDVMDNANYRAQTRFVTGFSFQCRAEVSGYYVVY